MNNIQYEEIKIYEAVFELGSDGEYATFLTIQVEGAEDEGDAQTKAYEHAEKFLGITSDRLRVVFIEELVTE